MMVFPYPMDLIMVFPYRYTLWILWPMDPMMVFPYPMDPYNGPIPYQCPALLSSPPLASFWLENTKNNLNNYDDKRIRMFLIYECSAGDVIGGRS